MIEFNREAIPYDPRPQWEKVEKAAASGRYLFWTVGGQPVSVAGIVRSLRTVAAIGAVFTPPEKRGRGYAGSATAALSERIFAEGKSAACLYTDLSNIYSNRCYARVGFRPYCDAWHYLRAALVFVGGPTRMPMVRAFFEEIVGRKGETGIDPMECVAQGAAIQAGVLSGESGAILLVDVTPLTLGIETLGGVATPLLARNTPIPAKRSEIFTTATDMQTSVTVHVFQGERPMALDNTSLGQFNLDRLPPAPAACQKSR